MSNNPNDLTAKTLRVIPAFVLLYGSFGAIQNVSQKFSDDIDKVVFIDNWLPVIAVLFFGTGWLVAHWIEIEIIKKRLVLSNFLFTGLLFGISLIAVYFHFYSDNEVLHQFSFASLFLTLGGYALRYSMFQNENRFFARTAILLQENTAEQ